jgi:hypothetical protein
MLIEFDRLLQQQLAESNHEDCDDGHECFRREINSVGRHLFRGEVDVYLATHRGRTIGCIVTHERSVLWSDRIVKSTAASEILKANVERAVSGDGDAVQYRRVLI